MKIRLTVTVDVDPAKWADEYGTGMTPAEVRADVRSYFDNHLSCAYAVAASGVAEVVAVR